MDIAGTIHAVEVKGTTGEMFTSVDITSQELEQAKRLRGSYHLYLVTKCMSKFPCLYSITDPWSEIGKETIKVEVALWRLKFFETH